MKVPGRIGAKVTRRLVERAGRHPFLPVGAGAGKGLRISMRNASADYLAGTNELPVQHALCGQLHPGDVFYDVGSNVGFFALLAARLVGPTGRVYAFEPVPVNADCVRDNAARNRFANVTVVPEALGAERGTGRLLLAVHPGGATLSSADAPVDVAGSLDVAVVPLDELVERGELAPPTFVKIDVEGSELDVLAGMTAVLTAHRPVVLCELDHPTGTGVEAKLARVEGVLRRHRYVVEVLPDSYPDSRWQVRHLLAVGGEEGSL